MTLRGREVTIKSSKIGAVFESQHLLLKISALNATQIAQIVSARLLFKDE